MNGAHGFTDTGVERSAQLKLIRLEAIAIRLVAIAFFLPFLFLYFFMLILFLCFLFLILRTACKLLKCWMSSFCCTIDHRFEGLKGSAQGLKGKRA